MDLVANEIIGVALSIEHLVMLGGDEHHLFCDAGHVIEHITSIRGVFSHFLQLVGLEAAGFVEDF